MTGSLRAVLPRAAALLPSPPPGRRWRRNRAASCKIQHWDSPASMSIHEEATYSMVVPIMGVMNNLVLYDQHIAQNSLNDRARPRRELVVERGRQGADLQAAPGRQMA